MTSVLQSMSTEPTSQASEALAAIFASAQVVRAGVVRAVREAAMAVELALRLDGVGLAVDVDGADLACLKPWLQRAGRASWLCRCRS